MHYVLCVIVVARLTIRSSGARKETRDLVPEKNESTGMDEDATIAKIPAYWCYHRIGGPRCSSGPDLCVFHWVFSVGTPRVKAPWYNQTEKGEAVVFDAGMGASDLKYKGLIIARHTWEAYTKGYASIFAEAEQGWLGCHLLGYLPGSSIQHVSDSVLKRIQTVFKTKPRAKTSTNWWGKTSYSTDTKNKESASEYFMESKNSVYNLLAGANKTGATNWLTTVSKNAWGWGHFNCHTFAQKLDCLFFNCKSKNTMMKIHTLGKGAPPKCADDLHLVSTNYDCKR